MCVRCVLILHDYERFISFQFISAVPIYHLHASLSLSLCLSKIEIKRAKKSPGAPSLTVNGELCLWAL